MILDFLKSFPIDPNGHSTKLLDTTKFGIKFGTKFFKTQKVDA